MGRYFRAKIVNIFQIIKDFGKILLFHLKIAFFI